MNDEQLLRYSRHILLPEIGVEGQERLLAAHALVIGAGGLGSPASLYLASAGIGTITLADGDVVDLTNLQRQILHTTASIGRPKVASGRETLAKLNPEARVVALEERLAPGRLDELVAAADVVLDCSAAPEVPSFALDVLRPRGTLVVVGYGRTPPLDLAPLARKELCVLGVRSGDRADLERVLALAAAGAIRLPQIATFPLARIDDAFAALRAGTLPGKAVVVP
jgi:threonine dehydrogenase-like Zn-dependent dehydrogenase